MRVLLISKDPKMYSICRKVLASLRNTRFELTVVPSNPPTDGDLYIWDYEADPALQGSDQVASRANIFLVEKENLSALRSRFDVPPIWTLLKPINAQLLESFISDPAIVREAPAIRLQGQTSAAHKEDLLEALLESNLFLQQTDQNRNDLIAQGARELRMPLMAALGYCGLLLDQQLGPLNADQLKVVQRMQQSAQRLLRLATSMFQSTGGAGGPMQARFQNGNFQECLDRAVAEVAPLVEARNLTIHRKCVPPRPKFSFDPEYITQLLANLLDHAVRFTPRGGEIRIRTQPVFWDRRAGNLSEGQPLPDRRGRRASEANAYRIEVQDPGPAIRQSRAENARECADIEVAGGMRPSVDFGFGLAMCNQIIELHRGRIVTDGIEPGYFACEVPYAPEAEAEGRSLRSPASAPLRVRVS